MRQIVRITAMRPEKPIGSPGRWETGGVTGRNDPGFGGDLKDLWCQDSHPAHIRSLIGNGEPETLPRAIRANCPNGADGAQEADYKSG